MARGFEPIWVRAASQSLSYGHQIILGNGGVVESYQDGMSRGIRFYCPVLDFLVH